MLRMSSRTLYNNSKLLAVYNERVKREKMYFGQACVFLVTENGEVFIDEQFVIMVA